MSVARRIHLPSNGKGAAQGHNHLMRDRDKRQQLQLSRTVDKMTDFTDSQPNSWTTTGTVVHQLRCCTEYRLYADKHDALRKPH